MHSRTTYYTYTREDKATEGYANCTVCLNLVQKVQHLYLVVHITPFEDLRRTLNMAILNRSDLRWLADAF